MTTPDPRSARGVRQLVAQGGDVPGAGLARIVDAIQAKRERAQDAPARRHLAASALRDSVRNDPDTSGLLDRLRNPDRIDGASGVVSLTTED